VLADYTLLKRRRGVIDFDDVLVHVARDMRLDPEFAAALRWRFRHLLVDEAQDLNPVQQALVDLLRHGRDDLFLVGDPSQAIYGFNGADPGLLLDVESRFAGVEVVRLPVNHRCTPQIVRAGVHVLATGRQPAELGSARAEGPAVELLVGADEQEEARQVARRLRATDPALVRSGQVAVLARTHAQLRGLQQALAGAGLPTRRPGTASGSPLPVAVREAAANRSAAQLRAWAHDTLDTPPAPGGGDAGHRRDHPTSHPTDRQGDRRAERGSEPERIDAGRRVAAAALEYLRDQPLGDGAGFRGWVATTDPFGDEERGVELVTFHAAKGREWHTVIVTGVETGLVPHRSATSAAQRQEEARLLYVAMTRATDHLTIARAERRGGYAREPSPLVATLDLSAPTIVAPPHRPRRSTDDRLAGALRTWRHAAARRARVLPQQLCSDHDLAAIARRRPASAEELVAVTSLGPLTARRLAPEILAVLDHGPSTSADGSVPESSGADPRPSPSRDQSSSRSRITGA
jgi:DNA helicase-2/ATP-dependent DNA helicase PcrA